MDLSALSPDHILIPRLICFNWLTQAMRLAFALLADNAGSSRLARIAIIAITTRSSISVNASLFILMAHYASTVIIEARPGKNLVTHVASRVAELVTRPVAGTNRSACCGGRCPSGTNTHSAYSTIRAEVPFHQKLLSLRRFAGLACSDDGLPRCRPAPPSCKPDLN